MNKVVLAIGMLMAYPLVGLAQVELSVVPTNACIHVAEAVSFKVSVRNTGASDISGLFILGGAYQGFEIDIEKHGNGPKDRFYNAATREMIAYDIMLQTVTLKSSESVSASYCLLYNVRNENYVFETPGEYEVHFRLLWNPNSGDTISATARVSVLEWDATKEEDRKQLKALAIWKNREIAAAYQDNAKWSDFASEQLRKLKDDYADTIYGNLASTVLERERAP